MKGNKLFVKSMIVTAIIGLTTLMIFMFIGIKYFTEQKVTAAAPTVETTELKKPSVPFNSVILGVVHELTNEKISVFDIEKKQYVKTAIKKSTQVEDERGKAIPLASINVGEIVEMSYEPAEDNLLSIAKAGESWKKTDLRNVEINKPQNEIILGTNKYEYTGNTLFLDKDGNKLNNIHMISPYDVLEMTGVNHDIYSIKVLGSKGAIQVEGLPVAAGRIEIDINRQVNLEEMKEPIPITPGNHKIGIYLDGYEPVIKHIEVGSGETVIITPKDVQKSYYDLNIVVVNGENEYAVEVDGKAYKPGEVPKLTKGEHQVSVMKEGFRKWEQKIMVEESRTLSAILTAIEKEPEVTKPPTPPTQEVIQANYSINISTNPAEADVYIDGTLKGKTPYNVTLPIGDYRVELKKEGYEDYSTSLIIDNSDSQNSYLYMLIPKIK